MEYNPDIYIPKLKYKPDIIKIDDNNFITISEYTRRLDAFFDVVFNNHGKEIFIGRYKKDYDNIRAAYNNGRILVYTDKYVSEYRKDFVIKVHTLYDILDDLHYILKEEDALELFDPNTSKEWLMEKDNLMLRTDAEKKYIIKDKQK